MYKIIQLLVAIAVLIQTTNANARPQKLFKNDTEILGAAHANLVIQEKLMTGSSNFCKKNHEELNEAVINSLREWNNRNKKYFILLESLREDIDDAMKNDGVNKSVEEYEAGLVGMVATAIIEAFEKKYHTLKSKDQFAFCQNITMESSKGVLDIANDPQIKAFLDQRLLDDAAPNLSVEIELPVPTTETAKSIEAKVQANLEAIGKYSITSKQTDKGGTSLSIIRITFERHFPRKVGRPLVDELFNAFDKNLPANLVFRVNLKVGLGDQIAVRIATKKT